jgi:hypothetical protein
MTNGHAAIDLSRCACCGNLLLDRYYAFIDRPERYCGQCIATRPRCQGCGAPMGNHHWQLHDGRLQCERCHATAVYEADEAKAIYEQTVAALVDQFGMRLNVGAAFRLIDGPTLEEIRSRGNRQPPAEPGRYTLGLYQRQGHLRVIYMLYGLPRLTFRTTVAHEYAHAWQGENCPLLSDELLREGFAEWVAYHHLHYLGCHKAAERMLESQHPYVPALRHVLALEAQLGLKGLMEYVRKAE